MAVDVAGTASSLLPKFSANVVLYIIITFLVVLALGFGFYFLFKRAKYNLTFIIYKDVDGKPKVIDRVKGMQLAHGRSGEKVFFVKKYKKYLPLGNLEMGARTYYYYIDKAGHWHNFDIAYIDVGKREPQLNMQLQMDYARDGINKRLEERHEKPGFWEKWGMVIVSITVIVVCLVFLWLIIRDSLANNSTAQANMQLSQKIQVDLNTKYTNLLTAMDNVCSGHNINVAQYLNQTT